MDLGYNTNGLAFHRLEDALALIAESGCRGVALTLDHHHLDPTDRDAARRQADRLAPLLESLRLKATIETGARFILDPRRKHQPTLISAEEEGRARRREFLETAVLLARQLGAECVSLWSGTPDDDAGEAEWQTRLIDGLKRLLDLAGACSVRLAFEPEPGMFIDTMARFDRLREQIDHPCFGLTLDVNHVHCLSDGDFADHARRHGDRLWNVHLSDACRGAHEHLLPGEGEIDFIHVRQALESIRYGGPVCLELSRHSHDAVRAMRAALEHLRRCGF